MAMNERHYRFKHGQDQASPDRSRILSEMSGSAAEIAHKLEHQGYCLLAKPHPDSPGFNSLLVALKEPPEGHSHDLQALHVCLAGATGDVGQEILTPGIGLRDGRQLALGRLILDDWARERVEFFAFGGLIEALPLAGEQVYLISSSAPILEIGDVPEAISDQLAFEVEGALARLEALLGLTRVELLWQLLGVEDLAVYAGAIQAILAHYEESGALRESFPELCAALRKERKWLQAIGQWPAELAALEALLDR